MIQGGHSSSTWPLKTPKLSESIRIEIHLPMKLKALCLALLFATAALPAAAQSNVVTINIVGYVNIPFHPGDNLFGNPLQGNSNNLLSTIIPQAPLGATISLWNSATRQFSTTSTFQD